MYYVTLSIVLVLAFSQCCLAEDSDLTIESSATCKFAEEIAKTFCIPDKTTDAIVEKISSCKSQLAVNPENKQKYDEFRKKVADKCAKDGQVELDKYTKVDTKKEMNALAILFYCSQSYRKCAKEVFQENGKKADSERYYKKLSDDDKEKFKTCVRTAIKV